MVTNAVKQHPPFAGLGLVVEPKGSWANNTNVSSDSDMDIKVEFTERAFQGSTAGMSYWDRLLQNNSYNGPWTPAKLRSELGIALGRVSNAVDAAICTAGAALERVVIGVGGGGARRPAPW
jgi:hypothetical protein